MPVAYPSRRHPCGPDLRSMENLPGRWTLGTLSEGKGGSIPLDEISATGAGRGSSRDQPFLQPHYGILPYCSII